MANIRQIAKQAGVSVATVSRVLNHPETVSGKTKDRIIEVMEEMNYTPNGIARSLALNKTSTIALLIPNIMNPLYPQMAKGIEEVVYQKGYNILLCNTEDDDEKERSYVDMLLEKRVDGFILISSSLDIKDIEKIKKQNIPFVLIGSNAEIEDENLVFTDYLMGAYQATQHLIEIGYRRIAHISGPMKRLESIHKLEGYHKALKEINIDIIKNYIVEGNNEVEGGYLAAKRLLQLEEPPKAIFAANDLMAIGAMEAIKCAGFKIPNDVAVVGFDDLNMASLVEPKLTTVSQPAYKMGLIAARLLLDNIENENKEDYKQKIFLHPKLKVRKSCGHDDRIIEIFN